ncbi:Hypothetical predicted protein [Octopus vulgaris]|uniref:Uncharacterized protein n=1 Tax=Octopus vulgaris TaxID=6645 RepID=A0AA36BMZ8_OCTVU|nr:Hypothetical predicted protein [Octopus vulgaris]
MEIAKVWRIISQRFSVSSFITFGLFLVLTITILHFDARTRKIEEKSTANRFLFKKSLDDKAVHTPRPGPGSLYTRWGRTKCPRVVGGSPYNDTGGGSNLLCLPNDPIWANYAGGDANGGHIYGSEYQHYFNEKKIFSYANAESIQDHNVPCAVCLTQQPAVVMMLPAMTQCYAGWTAEYSGYLMTEGHAEKGRHEYVCVWTMHQKLIQQVTETKMEPYYIL